jgi:hypothetical protein
MQIHNNIMLQEEVDVTIPLEIAYSTEVKGVSVLMNNVNKVQ